ncbi:MAG: hypothetical protein WD492_05275 [Alkalispirochaeta sp.]
MAIHDVANELAEELYSLGYFKFADSEVSGLRPAAQLHDQSGVPIQSVFHGISVAAVGYIGSDSSEKIVVYATRTSKKAIREFSESFSGYPATLASFGNIDVRPESAITATNGANCYVDGSRVACGSSAAPSGAGYAGTVGALVRNSDGLFALSNNHVFGGCNHTTVGHPILSPSANDTGPGLPYPKTLFSHYRFSPLHSGDPLQMNPSRMDAAIAKVEDASSVSSMQGSFYDTPIEPVDPIPGTRVKKVGRTTGLTVGKIESLSAWTVALPYKADKFRATVYFEDVAFVRGDNGDAFCAAGDSGSLVVTEDETRAVGLVFAVSSIGLGVIIPIKRVLEFFDVELVGRYGFNK